MRWAWVVIAMFMFAGCASPSDDATFNDTDKRDPDSTDPGTGGQEPAPDPQPEPDPDPEPEPEPEPGPPRDPVTWTIDIQGNDFVEGSLTIQIGDSIIWTQRDSVPHTVTADNGEFDSGTGPANRMVQGQTFEHEFTALGEFPYHCEVHPSMQDAITVVERFDGTP